MRVMRHFAEPPQRAVAWRGALIECGDTVTLADGRNGMFCFYEYERAHVSIPALPKWEQIEVQLSEIKSITKRRDAK